MAKDPKNFIEQLAASNDLKGRESVSTEVPDTRDRDILKDETVNPILTPSEIQRLENESTIVATVFNQVWKKLQPDVKGKTTLTPAERAAQMAGEKVPEFKELKNTALVKFALMVAGITTAAAMLFDFFGPVGRFFAKTLPKLMRPLGKLGKWIGKGMKAAKLGRLLKWFQKIGGGKILKFGRFIPFIGSLFSFGFAIARWRKGEYIPAIFEFISGVLNILPTGVTQIASIIIDGGLLLYDLHKEKKGEEGALGEPGKAGPPSGEIGLWGKIKNWVWNFPGVQNLVNLGKGVGAVLNGDWGAAADYFDKALPFIGATIRWLIKAGEETGDMAWRGFRSAKEWFGMMAEKIVGVFKSMITTIWEWITGAADWVVDKIKGIGEGAWEGLKSFGGWIGSGFGAFDDFMVRGDKIIPFNSEDDIIGAKPGGVFDRLIKQYETRVYNVTNIKQSDKGLFGKVVGGLKEIGKGLYKGGSILTKDFLGTGQVVTEIKKSNIILTLIWEQLDALNKGNAGDAPPPIVASVSDQNDDMSGSMEGSGPYPDSHASFYNSTYNIHAV